MYVWEPCCDTMKDVLGQDKPRAIPEHDGNAPSGGVFMLQLHLGTMRNPGLVLHIRYCPGCGKELRGKWRNP